MTSQLTGFQPWEYQKLLFAKNTAKTRSESIPLEERALQAGGYKHLQSPCTNGLAAVPTMPAGWRRASVCLEVDDISCPFSPPKALA